MAAVIVVNANIQTVLLADRIEIRVVVFAPLYPLVSHVRADLANWVALLPHVNHTWEMVVTTHH